MPEIEQIAPEGPAAGTTALQLAAVLLGVESLETWVTPRRQLGQSWDRLSRDLSRATDGRCRLSRELLRRHYGHISREPENQ